MLVQQPGMHCGTFDPVELQQERTRMDVSSENTVDRDVEGSQATSIDVHPQQAAVQGRQIASARGAAARTHLARGAAWERSDGT